MKCLQKFASDICVIFGDEYMRRPNNQDTERLLQTGATLDFPSMLDFIDCMHREWKNCSVMGKDQFCISNHGNPTMILKIVASQYIWTLTCIFGQECMSESTCLMKQRLIVYFLLFLNYYKKMNWVNFH